MEGDWCLAVNIDQCLALASGKGRPGQLGRGGGHAGCFMNCDSGTKEFMFILFAYLCFFYLR